MRPGQRKADTAHPRASQSYDVDVMWLGQGRGTPAKSSKTRKVGGFSEFLPIFPNFLDARAQKHTEGAANGTA